jgi:hypothetical protein
MEGLREAYPQAEFLNFSKVLRPAQDYFWDGIHVYDEANMLLAGRIYAEIEPVVKKRLPK